MANVVEFILKGDDLSKQAFQSATASAQRLNAATKEVSGQLRATGQIFSQTGNIASQFGLVSMAQVINSAESAIVTFRQLQTEASSSKLAIAALAAAAVSLGASLGNFIGDQVYGPQEKRRAELIKALEFHANANIEILKLEQNRAGAQEEIRFRIAQQVSTLKESKTLTAEVRDGAINALTKLGELQLAANLRQNLEEAKAIGTAITARFNALKSGESAVLAQTTQFFDELAKRAERLVGTEEERLSLLKRINAAREEEKETLAKMGVLAAAERDKALRDGLSSTVLFTEGAAAAGLSFLESQRGLATTYLQIWSESLLNVRAAFVNFSSTVIATFSQGIGNAVASIATGAQTASQAFKQLGAQMLGMLVSFAVRMAVNTLLALAFQASISKATVATALSIASAWAPAAAFASLATLGSNATAAAAAMVGTVALGTTLANVGLAGVAHGGLDRVPREGTYLLSGGERVVQPSANRDLESFLAEQNSGRRSTQVVVMIGERTLLDIVAEASRDGRLEIDARSVT